MLETFAEVVIEKTVQGYRIAAIADLIGFMFGCGGSHPESEFASTYGYIKGQLIVCTVPTGLTGAQELSVTGSVDGSLRTGIYPIPLMP